jgi:hypothetical protein
VSVSIAVLDEEGTLVLTALTNDVQIQIPNAAVGTYEFAVDADGGLVGPILNLRAGGRMIVPVSGSISVESLTGEGATGSFAFEGRDLETEAAVTVTSGRFDVRFTGGG